jgi:predicted extracellular nuclease
MNLTIRFIGIFCFFLVQDILAQTPTKFRALVYNVENLFDTIDDPTKDDADFLPNSKKGWNTKKYSEKLEHISNIVKETGFPEIVGLCEIENRGVLADLIKGDALVTKSYEIVHFESPDERGIDVALLVKSTIFNVSYSRPIAIRLPAENARTTRDILYAKLVFKKDTLHVFVNHWPSRRGGEEASEPNREAAASQLNSVKDSIFKKIPNAKFLVIGDFNDYPTSKSLKDVLGASLDPSVAKRSGLVNMSASLFANGEGSEFYEGKWTMLINIIVSTSFLKAGKGLKADAVKIYKPDYLLHKNEKTGEVSPNRTFIGNKYVGGYSDHLPEILDFEWKK